MLDTLKILYDYHERCGIAGKDIALQQIVDEFGVDDFFIQQVDRMGEYGQAGHAIGAHQDLDYIKQTLQAHHLDASMVAIKRVGAYYVVYSKIATHRLPWAGWQNQKS